MAAVTYCTAADVRAFARDPEMDETTLGLLVAAVSRAIDRYCRRRFYVVAQSHVYDWPEDGSIRLRDDLYALTRLTTDADQTFGPDDCVLTPRGGPPYQRIRLKRGATTPLRYAVTPDGAVTVDGQWGYSEEAPAEIKLAAILWVADLYMTSDMRGLGGLNADAVSAQVVERLDTPPKDALPLLNPYRKVRIEVLGGR